MQGWGNLGAVEKPPKSASYERESCRTHFFQVSSPGMSGFAVEPEEPLVLSKIFRRIVKELIPVEEKLYIRDDDSKNGLNFDLNYTWNNLYVL